MLPSFGVIGPSVAGVAEPLGSSRRMRSAQKPVHDPRGGVVSEPRRAGICGVKSKPWVGTSLPRLLLVRSSHIGGAFGQSFAGLRGGASAFVTKPCDYLDSPAICAQ